MQQGDAAGSPSGLLGYDVLNRLNDVKYTANYGNGSISFNHLLPMYRGDGLRASKQVSVNGTLQPAIYFLYDGTRVVCELDGAGNVSASYGYGAAGLAQTYTQIVYTAYCYDPMGNVTSRVGQNSDVNVPAGSTPGYDFSLFDAFGNLAVYRLPGHNIMDAYPPNDHVGYGGQWGNYTDAETGLVLMGFRYYSPTYCRFLTRDPSGYEGGINVYAYCRNNPIMCADPTGLDLVNLSPNAVAQAIARLVALRASSTVAEAVQNGISAAELLSASLPVSQARDTVAVADPFGNYHQQHPVGHPEVGAFVYQQGDSGPVTLGPLLSGDPNSITFGQPRPPVGFHTVGTLHTHPRLPLTVDIFREYFSSLDASSGVNTGLLQPGFGTAYLGAPSGNIYSLAPSDSMSANGQPSPNNVTTRPFGPGGTVIGRHWGIWKFTASRPPLATLR